MAISLAGLASANLGALQAQRQRVTDEQANRKAQEDQLQLDQLNRQEALRQRVDPVINGTPGLGDANPATQTNGSRLADSEMGLFSASPSPQPASQQPVPSMGASTPGLVQQAQQPATQQPAASMGASTPSLAQPVAASGAAGISASQPAAQTQPAPSPSISGLMQQRVNAYAKANPNDIQGINAMQAKVYDAAQNEVAKKQNVFLAQGNEALRKLIAFNDVSGVQDLMSNHWPDGKQYQFQANKDGSYDVAEVGGNRAQHFNNMDELGRAITNVLNPMQYQAAHAKAQESGLTESAKLPAQQALEVTKAGAKADGDIAVGNATGVTDKNKGDAARFYGMGNLYNARADGDTFDTAQKRALAEAKAQLDAVDQVAEPSKYKELQKKVERLTPTQVNQGGLHTSIGENDSGMKVPIITDPVTGKVYQGGNVIYDRSLGFVPPTQTPPAAATLPSGFKPL